MIDYNEELEKIAKGWRNKLKLGDVFFIMEKTTIESSTWSMVDCSMTQKESAVKAFNKRAEQTRSGVLALVGSDNKVLEIVVK